MNTPPSRPTLSRSHLALGAIAILLLTFVAYWPAIHAGFIWDDDDMLTNNPLIIGPEGLKAIWSGSKFYDFWPLTLTSFWVEWRLWGMNAMGYHLTNIFLHALTAIFFWRILKHLKVPGAWIAALIFAIHPINVQSVAWITERKNTLSMFLCALALLFYLRYLIFSGRKWYWAALGIFGLALLSKTSIVLLPFVLLACVWWLRGKIGKREFLDTLPFFALGLALGLVTIWFQYSRSISTDVVNSNSFLARLISAGMACWFYLARILFPRHPMFVYPRWSFSPLQWFNYIPGVLFLSFVFLFWRCRKGWGRPWFFAFASFLVMLFPVLGFFNIYFQKYTFVADYWLYPSIIAIIALVVGGVAHVVQRASAPPEVDPREARRNPELLQPRSKAPRMIGCAAAAAVSAVLIFLTWTQCGIYQNEETLWRATVKVNRTSSLASHNLAGVIVNQVKSELPSRGLDSSLRDKLQEALRCEQNAIAWKENHAGANYGAGYILALLDRLEEAIPYYQRAIELQPDMLEALDSLAWILATCQKDSVRNGAEAVRLAKSAVALTGDNDPKTLETLGVALAEAGDFSSAAATAEKALKLAGAAGDNDLARDLQMQLRLFQSMRAFHAR